MSYEGRVNSGQISQSMQLLSTNLQQKYIVFSRETVRRLQRLIYLAIETGFILVLGIAAFALVQRSRGHDYEGESRKETPDSSS